MNRLDKQQDTELCASMTNTLKSKDTNRLKIKGWKKTYHVNTNQKKPGGTLLLSDKVDFMSKEYDQG